MAEPVSEAHSNAGREERRTHPHLRSIFEEAYTLALPFLDPAQGLGGQSMVRHAYVIIHEAFPQLTTQDVAVLVRGLERVFRARSKAG